MNTDLSYFSVGIQKSLKEVKASGRCHEIGKECFMQHKADYGHNYAEA